MKKNFLKALLALCMATVVSFGVACRNNQGDSSASSSSSSSSSSSTPSDSVPPDSSVPSGELTQEQIAEDLLNDEFAAGQTTSKGQDPHYPTDENWNNFLARSERLDVGEKVVEDFQCDPYSMWFYPSYGVHHGGTFYYGEGDEEVIEGQRSIVFLCDGFANGGNFDRITFKGVKLQKNATYKVKITAKILTTGRSFWFFLTNSGEDANELFAMNGQTPGEVITREHTFIATSDSNFFGIEAEQSADGDKFAIGSIELERVDSAPVVTNAQVTKNSEYSYSASNSDYDVEVDAQTGTTYSWFAAIDRSGLGKIDLGMTTQSITLTEQQKNSLAGYIVGCNMTVSNNGVNGANGKAVTAYSPTAVEGELVFDGDENFDETGSTLELYNVGDKYIENFAALPYGISVEAFWGSLTGYSIASNPLSINGYTCFVNYSDASSRPALIINGMKFAPNSTYTMSFDLKIISETKPTTVCAEWQYGNIGLMSAPLSNFVEDTNGVRRVTFTFTTPDTVVSSARPIVYLDNIAGNQTEVSWALDNFVLELTAKKAVLDNAEETFSEDGSVTVLENVGDKYIENFGEIAEGITYDASWGSLTAHGALATEDSIDGKSYFLEYSDASNRPAALMQGIAYAANTTYSLSIDVKIISETAPTVFCMELQNSGTFKQVNLSDFETVDGVTRVTVEFTTGDDVVEMDNLLFYMDNMEGNTGAISVCFDNLVLELKNK